MDAKLTFHVNPAEHALLLKLEDIPTETADAIGLLPIPEGTAPADQTLHLDAEEMEELADYLLLSFHGTTDKEMRKAIDALRKRVDQILRELLDDDESFEEKEEPQV